MRQAHAELVYNLSELQQAYKLIYSANLRLIPGQGHQCVLRNAFGA